MDSTKVFQNFFSSEEETRPHTFTTGPQVKSLQSVFFYLKEDTVAGKQSFGRAKVSHNLLPSLFHHMYVLIRKGC